MYFASSSQHLRSIPVSTPHMSRRSGDEEAGCLLLDLVAAEYVTFVTFSDYTWTTLGQIWISRSDINEIGFNNTEIFWFDSSAGYQVGLQL